MERDFGLIFVRVSVTLAFTIMFIGIAALVEWQFPQFAANRQPQTLEQRITTLTRSLNDATGLISEIEQEVQRRQQLATKLQADADTAKQLSALNSQQVAAVAQELRGTLEAENRSQFWTSIITNVFFAFLGAAFSEIIHAIRQRSATRRSGERKAPNE